MNQESKSISILLTRAEADLGCQKEIFCDGMHTPITVTLQPGIEEGHQLCLENVPFTDKQGFVQYYRLQVNVRVRKKTHSGAIIAAVIVLGILLAVVAGAIMRPDESQHRYYDGPAMDPAEVFPHYELRYYLSQMDPELQQAAALLYTAAMDFETSCKLPRGIHEDELFKIALILKTECPELMQLDMAYDLRFRCDDETGDVYKVNFTYSSDGDDYEDMLLRCQDRIEQILAGTEEMTDWEIEKHIFDDLAMDIIYDIDAAHSWNACGALVDGKAKCDGIAAAMKWCLEEAGIQALCILGDPKEGDVGHAWNIVRLDEKYYNLDLTASVRHAEDTGTEFENEILYFQYNVSDLWTTKDYIVNSAFTDLVEKPVCSLDGSSYYAKQDRYIYEERNHDAEFVKYMSISLQSRKPVMFQVEDDHEYLQLVNRLKNKDLGILGVPGQNAVRIQYRYIVMEYNVIWVHITWEPI